MRAYLDYNATAPLRPQAREAMLRAMDVAGNPSSVHAEGRAARALVERARGVVAEATGCAAGDVVFVSGASEAAALLLAGRGLHGSGVEHEAVGAWVDETLPVDADGRVSVAEPATATLQLANSETGVIQDLPAGLAVADVTQGFGRIPFGFDWSGIGAAFLSAHKFGGPKGIGALLLQPGTDLAAQVRGGGQEMGRRAGTENIIGIAGMAAAAAAAQADLANGVWERVAALRDRLEQAIAGAAPDLIYPGRGAPRLPNTSCIAVPGWKGETQVLQMDLAGYAVSAGSACSSGKLRPSRVLRAMGLDETAASSAIRVSLGPETQDDEIMRFAQTWTAALSKRRARAA